MIDNIAAANKALVRKFYRDVYVDWKLSMVNEVVSNEFTSHDWPEGGPTGPQAFLDYYAAIRFAVPDAHYEVDDLIAESDRVVVRWRMLGTHQGQFGGIMPTGRAITLRGIAIYRLDAGKMMERWVVADLHGLLKEIGGSSARSNHDESDEQSSRSTVPLGVAAAAVDRVARRSPTRRPRREILPRERS